MCSCALRRNDQSDRLLNFVIPRTAPNVIDKFICRRQPYEGGRLQFQQQMGTDMRVTFSVPGVRHGWLPGIPATLSKRELRRRFWHMSPGLLPFVLQAVPHQDPISPTLRGIILIVAAVIAGRIFLGFRRIQRTSERGGGAAVAGYVLSVLTMMLLFPRHLEMSLALLAILAFGDGSATLFGLLLRGPRLPWNRDKSWTGLGAFVTAGTLTSAWIYFGESLNIESADPPVTFLQALLLVLPAVVAAAVGESIRSRINDNVRVGVIAGLVLMLTHLYRPM